MFVPQLLEEPRVQDSGLLLLVVEILPSLTITAINVVAAPLFQIIVAVEDYPPETEVAVTIARSVVVVAETEVAITIARSVVLVETEVAIAIAGSVVLETEVAITIARSVRRSAFFSYR